MYAKQLGLFALLLATPAWGADLGGTLADPLAPLATPGTRNFSCYLGLGGTGGYTREGTNVMGIMAVDQGAAAVGVAPNVGCDLQFSWGVIGLEGDYDVQSTKIGSQFLGLNGNTTIGDEYAVNGRLGFWTSQKRHTLIYLMGGYVGSSDRSFSLATFKAPFSGPSGPDFGGGVETELGKIGAATITAYGEYRHEWLGSSSSTLAGIPTSISTDVDRVTAGLRLRF